MNGRIGNRSLVKDCVEHDIPKLCFPIKLREVGSDQITAKIFKVLEFTRTKIIDDRRSCLAVPFLQCDRRIRLDKAGASRHQNILHGAKNKDLKDGRQVARER